MKAIKKQFEKKWGYIPTDEEIFTLYRMGSLILTDKQENEILKLIN